MFDKKYVLFIDSGIGGLSIVKAFLDKKPNTNIIHYADVFNYPYGTKDEDYIGDILCNIYNDVSRDYDIEMIVIACNTASVSALDFLRSKIDTIPIVGTVPAIKTAAQRTKNGRIGVVATETTLKLNYVNGLIEKFAKNKQVFTKPSRLLVDAAEQFFTSSDVEAVVESELSFFKEKDVDCLVLGCTHYSFLFEDIQRYFGKGVEIIDSREGVSKRAVSLMPKSVIDKDPHHLLILSKDDRDILRRYEKFNELLSIFNDITIREISNLN